MYIYMEHVFLPVGLTVFKTVFDKQPSELIYIRHAFKNLTLFCVINVHSQKKLYYYSYIGRYLKAVRTIVFKFIKLCHLWIFILFIIDIASVLLIPGTVRSNYYCIRYSWNIMPGWNCGFYSRHYVIVMSFQCMYNITIQRHELQFSVPFYHIILYFFAIFFIRVTFSHLICPNNLKGMR